MLSKKCALTFGTILHGVGSRGNLSSGSFVARSFRDTQRFTLHRRSFGNGFGQPTGSSFNPMRATEVYLGEQFRRIYEPRYLGCFTH